MVASLWPGILASDKPIAHLGLGGPDTAALAKRLPNDKVPMVLATGVLRFAMLPNQWVFFSRNSYAVDALAFFNWVHLNLIKGRPIQVGVVCTKVLPTMVDNFNQFEDIIKATPWIKIVGTEWVDIRPATLITEVRRLAKEKPDFIWIPTTAAHVLGTIKSEKELGIHIPVLVNTHNGIQMCTKASKDITLLEGHYEAAGIDPAIDLTIPAAKIVIDQWKKMGIESQWDIVALQSLLPHLAVLVAVERAAAMVGPQKITGETIYNSLLAKPITEADFLGCGPSVAFTKETTWPAKDLKVKATTVTNGKQVLVSKDWMPVPSFSVK